MEMGIQYTSKNSHVDNGASMNIIAVESAKSMKLKLHITTDRSATTIFGYLMNQFSLFRVPYRVSKHAALA
jgi:hypothetical protein